MHPGVLGMRASCSNYNACAQSPFDKQKLQFCIHTDKRSNAYGGAVIFFETHWFLYTSHSHQVHVIAIIRWNSWHLDNRQWRSFQFAPGLLRPDTFYVAPEQLWPFKRNSHGSKQWLKLFFSISCSFSRSLWAVPNIVRVSELPVAIPHSTLSIHSATFSTKGRRARHHCEGKMLWEIRNEWDTSAL